MKTFQFATLFISLVLFSNCASIIHGSKQDIAFSSNPSGAEITINGENRGRTPASISLNRNQDYLVKIQLAGYLPYEINVSKKVDGWVFGNIIFGGIIGLIVDASTGAMYKLSPEQINAALSQGNASFLQKSNQIYVAVTMKADPSWQKVGYLQPIIN